MLFSKQAIKKYYLKIFFQGSLSCFLRLLHFYHPLCLLRFGGARVMGNGWCACVSLMISNTAGFNFSSVPSSGPVEEAF